MRCHVSIYVLVTMHYFASIHINNHMQILLFFSPMRNYYYWQSKSVSLKLWPLQFCSKQFVQRCLHHQTHCFKFCPFPQQASLFWSLIVWMKKWGNVDLELVETCPSSVYSTRKQMYPQMIHLPLGTKVIQHSVPLKIYSTFLIKYEGEGSLHILNSR